MPLDPLRSRDLRDDCPVFIFVMAMLLLCHRLLWPMVERPLDKLNRIGITKHPKIIATIGTLLILIALGKLFWLETVLKYLPIK